MDCPELDLDGWELAILNYDETQLTWANTRILVDEADGDILNDALYKRNSELMSALISLCVSTR